MTQQLAAIRIPCDHRTHAADVRDGITRCGRQFDRCSAFGPATVSNVTCDPCRDTLPTPPKPAEKVAKLRQLPDGRIEALSSDGHTIYRVTVAGAGSCTCPAGQRGALCYHLRTARERYALPANVVPFPARRATKDLLYA